MNHWEAETWQNNACYQLNMSGYNECCVHNQLYKNFRDLENRFLFYRNDFGFFYLKLELINEKYLISKKKKKKKISRTLYLQKYLRYQIHSNHQSTPSKLVYNNSVNIIHIQTEYIFNQSLKKIVHSKIIMINT